jgi:YidC/Oxa1 family membrane protein insertase
MLLQLPVLIALFAVLRGGGLTHIPMDSRLHRDIVAQHTSFLGANMLCTAGQAGRNVKIDYKGVPATDQIRGAELKCGHGVPVRIPYYIFIAGMVATTYYQQRQMQKASPGVVNQQQQTLARVMPIMFGTLGFIYQSGLVLYWTTANIFQIGQQVVLLPKIGQATGASEQRAATGGPGGAGKRGPRTGPRPNTGRSARPRRGSEPRGDGSGGRRGREGQGRDPAGGSDQPGPPRASQGGSGRTTGSSGSKGSSGGRNAGDRKKRRKR